MYSRRFTTPPPTSRTTLRQQVPRTDDSLSADPGRNAARVYTVNQRRYPVRLARTTNSATILIGHFRSFMNVVRVTLISCSWALELSWVYVPREMTGKLLRYSAADSDTPECFAGEVTRATQRNHPLILLATLIGCFVGLRCTW